MLWTSYDSPIELRQELEEIISLLSTNDYSKIHDLYVHFLPSSTFQEHSMSNGWSKEYLKLSSKFDKLYHRLKK